MMTLEHLHEFLMAPRAGKLLPKLRCADGFQMSVQVGACHYCSPRADTGPWSAVEVGFPSERDERLMPYAEDDSDPTDTVYGWVPVDVVVDVVNAHGGPIPGWDMAPTRPPVVVSDAVTKKAYLLAAAFRVMLRERGE